MRVKRWAWEVVDKWGHVIEPFDDKVTAEHYAAAWNIYRKDDNKLIVQERRE